MKNQMLSKFVHDARNVIVKHSPEILTAVGIAGMVTTTIMAIKVTPKAMKLIHEAKMEKSNDDTSELTPAEVVKATWKCYIPSAIMWSLSIACLVGASSVHLKRNAAIATAYTLSETALKEYQDKVVETIGEKKEQVVRDKIAKDRIDENPVSGNQVFVTGKGETLCYDVMSDRYFKSDMDKLQKSVNDLNRQMRDEMSISLNDFYCEIGLNPIGIGDDIGWNIDRGYIDLNFSSQLADDGTPCLVVGHYTRPQYDYR